MAEQQGKGDLNTADRRELAEIIGIGDECADRIIQYREQHGRIGSVEEPTEELKGFGEQAMRHLREQART
jgi:competence protein ComEA